MLQLLLNREQLSRILWDTSTKVGAQANALRTWQMLLASRCKQLPQAALCFCGLGLETRIMDTTQPELAGGLNDVALGRTMKHLSHAVASVARATPSIAR